MSPDTLRIQIHKHGVLVFSSEGRGGISIDDMCALIKLMPILALMNGHISNHYEAAFALTTEKGGVAWMADLGISAYANRGEK